MVRAQHQVMLEIHTQPFLHALVFVVLILLERLVKLKKNTGHNAYTHAVAIKHKSSMDI